MTVLWVLLGLAALVLVLSFLCFVGVFCTLPRTEKGLQKLRIPHGKIYLPYKEQMFAWTRETRAMDCEEVSIRSFDGLTLRGKYYECQPGAPVELMFHGYRGTSERDLCGGVQRCFLLGHNALVVDQRAAGRSGGHVITFGIRESRDCADWARFAAEKFGPRCKLILCGLSMGAATVLMAAGEELPEQVVGVLADCGYTTPKAIICKCADQMHVPSKLVWPLVRLGARLFGGFDLEERSPLEVMGRCSLPVIFFHGEDDNFVPCAMSRENYDACTAPKKLVTVPGAGHGLSYIIDPEGYLEALREMEREHWSKEKERSGLV